MSSKYVFSKFKCFYIIKNNKEDFSLNRFTVSLDLFKISVYEIWSCGVVYACGEQFYIWMRAYTKWNPE